MGEKESMENMVVAADMDTVKSRERATMILTMTMTMAMIMAALMTTIAHMTTIALMTAVAHMIMGTTTTHMITQLLQAPEVTQARLEKESMENMVVAADMDTVKSRERATMILTMTMTMAMIMAALMTTIAHMIMDMATTMITATKHMIT